MNLWAIWGEGTCFIPLKKVSQLLTRDWREIYLLIETITLSPSPNGSPSPRILQHSSNISLLSTHYGSGIILGTEDMVGIRQTGVCSQGTHILAGEMDDRRMDSNR